MDPLQHRRDYTMDQLGDEEISSEPLAQLASWLDDAARAEIAEPNAMVVATVDPSGAPSTRTVLLRGLDHGLCFYTNRASRKGVALAHRAEASALFPWYALQRQAIVVGRVERLTPADDDGYFAARPRKSQIAARASAQSRPIASRAELERAYRDEERLHPDGAPIERPADWGGYRIVPREVEFWQGRRSRLHDRLVFTRDDADAPWSLRRLQP